jgi:hypothetical protein
VLPKKAPWIGQASPGDSAEPPRVRARERGKLP